MACAVLCLAAAPAFAGERAMPICLVHAGPSDKSFPVVCLGGTPSDDPLRIVVPSSDENAALFDALLAGAGGADCADDPGAYRVEGSETFVCGGAWRAFLADLADLTGESRVEALHARLR